MADSSSSRQDLNSCKYDVFINFRGEDTRTRFVSYLHDALRRKGIDAYKDDVNLPRGEEISPALVKAIEDSKISVVVFSENYATSGWCLDELVHILRCKRENKQIVLPVFYGVDPSHVRNQKGSYASAFDAHENRFRDDLTKVNKWRSALKEAGNLSGWDSRTAGSEPEFLEKIVQDILQKLSSMSPTKGDELESKLVGVEDRLKKIEELLCFDSPDVRIVGIWGMGGIGKTALAEEIKKRFASRFESCFFEDVSEGVKRCGLGDFKKSLFATLLNDKNIDMNSSFNKVRLQRRKVLVVLDNVDNLRHLVSLIGEFPQNKSQFGEGSKILITSRDTESFQADATYKVAELIFEKALKLFYQNAFRTGSSKVTEYEKLSKEVVGYAGGNPLALIVLGSYLYSESSKGPRSIKEWDSALIGLKNAPNKDIQEVLKISYNALDHQKQSIFLDIACFFKGKRRKIVEEILGDDSLIGINVLIEKSLITIKYGELGDGELGELWMHDLMQEMAWEIVRQESKELEQRSRLWIAEDVYRIMKANKGSAKIEGICLDMSKISRDLFLKPTIFEQMCNLRILKIHNKDWEFRCNLISDQGLKFLPGLEFQLDSLRYLCWSYWPLKSLPSNFEPQNLVRLEMSFSKLEKLWDGVQHLGNLKHIDLSGSEELIELPNLSQAPNLKMINVTDCTSLREFRELPVNLKYLYMNSTAIYRFDSIQPRDEQSNFSSHKRLTIYDSSLKEYSSLGSPWSPFESSFPYSKQQKHTKSRLPFMMYGTQGCTFLGSSIIHKFESLEEIDARQCTSLHYFNIINSKSLKMIDVTRCTSLKVLNAGGCKSLWRIDATGCTSLEVLNAGNCKSLETIDITGCRSLEDLNT